MGEAKRRKATDPNYGKVPKAHPEHGIVVCPPVEVQERGLFARSSNLDPQELRFALLFWDNLVWPSSRAIYFASNDHELFLESAGVLRRPEYTFNGDVAQGFALGQIQAFRDLDSKAPGCWALAQGENSLLLKNGLLEQSGGLAVSLHRAIPIPTTEVPLAEILEFRSRRRDQLQLLRYQMDKLMQDIERSGNSPDAVASAAAAVNDACQDLLRVSHEWQFPVHVANVKTTFSLSPGKLGSSAFAGWTFAKEFGLLAGAVAAGVGAVASVIEMKGDFGVRSLKRPASPYRYAYSINSDLN